MAVDFLSRGPAVRSCLASAAKLTRDGRESFRNSTLEDAVPSLGLLTSVIDEEEGDMNDDETASEGDKGKEIKDEDDEKDGERESEDEAKRDQGKDLMVDRKVVLILSNLLIPVMDWDDDDGDDGDADDGERRR